MESFFRALFYGLLVHAILYLCLLFIKLPPLSFDPEIKKNVVEFDVRDVKKLDNLNRPDRPIIRETELPKEILEEDDEAARFLSLQQKRVKEQTKAYKTGLTKNRSSEAALARQRSQTQALPNLKKFAPSLAAKESQITDATKKVEKGLADFHPDMKPTLPSQATFSETGMSTLGEVLPESIQIGTFTAVNTDRYLYYSFFARIDEAIRYRWESRVRMAMDRAAGQIRFSSITEWVTLIEVILKANGEYHTSQIMKKSGIDGFDLAPIEAFQEARFFPHPPKEMIDSDGFIRLKYSFRVFFDAKSYVRNRD